MIWAIIVGIVLCLEILDGIITNRRIENFYIWRLKQEKFKRWYSSAEWIE